MTATFELTPARQAVLDRIHARHRAVVPARIEELEFLAGAGTPLVEAVARVGWTLPAASKALYRHGHPLAAAVEREASRARRAE